MTVKALLGSLSLVWLALSAMAQNTVRIGGSDLLGAVLHPALEQAAQERGWDIDLNFEGLAARSALTGKW
jgi:hypothetical protein